ncbi:hypothetical protein BJ165DRAFT_1529553 [Panaeolus papilionaceus]|nr:hypothetical protein BJ165DRAFT_1529553 [Panaeolus papilionaceus]
MDTYHQVSDHTMEQLYEELEALIDEQGEPGYEVEYHSGVLTLNLGPRGTYVINKQPPNKQIWLSSPVSGPKRYDLTPNGEWTYLRNGITLDTLLNTELNQVFMQRVEFDLSIPMERLGVWNGSGES